MNEPTLPTPPPVPQAAAAAPPATPADLDTLLGPLARRRVPRRLLLAAVALLAAAALAWWWFAARSDAGPRYDTQPVTRGSITVTVSANGTLQPTNQVAIGSELSGTVSRVLVDVNDRVQRGQVLAELDTARLTEQATATRATIAAAQAAVRQAEATRDEARATLSRLQAVHRASGGRVPSAAELDAARAATARAEAALASARAGVEQGQAQLRAELTNLRKTAIRSPISGVVLARSVDPGNAVAASLQAVTLFTLAEDLTKMKLQVHVDEADVGQVKPGQRATFTVAAYPARRYPATISRVGWGPTTKDNVVTYLAELAVDNADLTLRPGMTATATITTLQRDGVLLVPNAALRFDPDAAAAAAQRGGSGGVVERLVPRLPRGGAARSARTDTAQVRRVWVLRDGRAVPVAVMPGASDGRHTELVGGTLQPGTPVIVAQRAADE